MRSRNDAVCRRRLILLSAAIAWAAAAPAAVDLATSVAMVQVVNQGYDPVNPWKQESMSRGTGTGFVIEGGRILTNAHNVTDCKYVELRSEGSAQRYPAVVAFVGHDCDLAVVIPMDSTFFEGNCIEQRIVLTRISEKIRRPRNAVISAIWSIDKRKRSASLFLK